MTARPAHTPYSGLSTPFTIGLRPHDLSSWLEIDRFYRDYVEEKDRLIASRPADVFAAEPDTLDAQREVLDLVRADLDGRIPLIDDPDVRAFATARTTADPSEDEGEDEADLQRAGRLVQEDLVLMRRGDDGWRLAAASLCFPSSWSLADKFGKPLSTIHVPVPSFGPGTRNALLIDRIFDRLQVDQPVERLNWSLQADPERHKPMTVGARGERGRVRPSRFPDAEAAARAFIRVERQTLRRLPRSGDILFTIRIHLDPLALLEGHPDGRKLAASFAGQLLQLEGSQLDYKGLTADRDRLAAALDAIAQG